GSEPEEWGNGFLPSIGSGGLPPGGTTAPLTIKSQLGYTGSDQSRAEMLQNTQFVDAKVELAAKYGGPQGKRPGQYPIPPPAVPPASRPRRARRNCPRRPQSCGGDSRKLLHLTLIGRRVVGRDPHVEGQCLVARRAHFDAMRTGVDVQPLEDTVEVVDDADVI